MICLHMGGFLYEKDKHFELNYQTKLNISPRISQKTEHYLYKIKYNLIKPNHPFISKHRVPPPLWLQAISECPLGGEREPVRRLVCKQIRAGSGNQKRARFLSAPAARSHAPKTTALEKKTQKKKKTEEAQFHFTLVSEIRNKTFPSCNT